MIPTPDAGVPLGNESRFGGTESFSDDKMSKHREEQTATGGTTYTDKHYQGLQFERILHSVNEKNEVSSNSKILSLLFSLYETPYITEVHDQMSVQLFYKM